MLLASQCVSQSVAFGDFRFNVPTRELLRIGNHGSATPVTLGSRAADLLHLFVDRPGELITKSEIMDAVWPNIAVEESNLTVQVSALRRALGGRTGARYIQTIPGRGYRFTPWVDEFAAQVDDAKPEPAFAIGSGTVVLSNGVDALANVAAGPPRHGLTALPELAPRSSVAAASPEVPADAPMAVSRVAQANIWWLSWLNGVAGIILGLMLVTAPGMTSATLVFFLGLYWLIMGMLALVRVFADPSVPWFWSLIIGVVGILVGVFVVRYLLVAALIPSTAIVAALGAQGLIMGSLEIIIGVTGAGIAAFILGTVYLLIGLFLLGSPVVPVLATPLAFGVLFLFQGVALTIFAFRARS